MLRTIPDITLLKFLSISTDRNNSTELRQQVVYTD